MTHHNAKPRPTNEELRRLYHDELLTKAEVAARIGVSRFTINQWLKDAGVKTRSRGRASQIRELRKRDKDTAQIVTDLAEMRPFLRLQPAIQKRIRQQIQEMLEYKQEVYYA